MTPKVVVLNDQSEQILELVRKLKAYGFLVVEASSPLEAQEKTASGQPHLFVASGDYQEIDTPRLAEKIFDAHSTPTFLVLTSAGDTTQNRIIRHPGIIGVFFSPLNVEKLFERIRKFFDMMEAPQ